MNTFLRVRTARIALAVTVAGVIAFCWYSFHAGKFGKTVFAAAVLHYADQLKSEGRAHWTIFVSGQLDQQDAVGITNEKDFGVITKFDLSGASAREIIERQKARPPDSMTLTFDELYRGSNNTSVIKVYVSYGSGGGKVERLTVRRTSKGWRVVQVLNLGFS